MNPIRDFAQIAIGGYTHVGMIRITLNLPEKTAAELAEASRQTNRALHDLAIELLQGALATRRFRSAREAILNSLGERTPKTDEEAFKMLS